MIVLCRRAYGSATAARTADCQAAISAFSSGLGVGLQSDGAKRPSRIRLAGSCSGFRNPSSRGRLAAAGLSQKRVPFANSSQWHPAPWIGWAIHWELAIVQKTVGQKLLGHVEIPTVNDTT